MDVDESMDQSMMSQATVKPKSTKKTTKGKGKSAKGKKEDADMEGQMDVDESQAAQPEPPKPKRTGRGKKRASEEMNNDEHDTATAEARQSSPPPAEPPTKRRATRARSSSVSQSYGHEHQDYTMADTASADEPPQGEDTTTKGRKKKGSASKSRKASDVSVASKSTSKARMPRDSELDAALEADLAADRPQSTEPEPEPVKPRPSKKTKNSKKSKAVPKSPDPEDIVLHVDARGEQTETAEGPSSADVNEPEEPAPKSKSTKPSRKKGTKKSKKEESPKAKPSTKQCDRKSVGDDKDDLERHESFVSVEIVNKEPEARPEPEEEPEEEPEVKSVAKKASKEDKPKKSKKTKKKEQTPSPPEPARDQRDLRSPSRDEDVFGTPNDIPDQVEMVTAPQTLSPEPQQAHRRTPVPPKTAKRFSDIPQEKRLAQSFTESQRSCSGGRQNNSRSSNKPVSPLPEAHQSTPSLSPQSSDAENRPPSSRPSASRPPVPSASMEQKARTPLAASTPSPSKRNANAGFPPSSHPWTPIDIDEVLYGEASDKENADLSGIFKNMKGTLTSPEKKMTVEEWIMWNAKNGEERLKRECERLVNHFEREGSRAMQRLEAIECID